MWSRRNAFPLTRIQNSDCIALASTPSPPRHTVSQDSNPEDEGTESKVNFITCLAYVLIPEVSREEAECILSWVLDNDNAGQHDDCVTALKQIEYFFSGTDAGQVLMFPLLPPSMYPYAAKRTTTTATKEKEEKVRPPVPWNAGPKRLLHCHRHDEPVLSVGTLGTLVASGGTDAHLHLSVFHPVPQHVVTIPHPSPLRSLLLWEGGTLLAKETDPQQRCSLAEAECSIVYIITGDESGVVRLWRVDVEKNTYFLSTIFAISTASGCVGFLSPLHYLAYDDGSREKPPTRESKVIHCLAIDDDERLLAGVNGGIVVWSLAGLPWKHQEEDHILCWDDEQRRMVLDATPRLRFRAERLVNVSVWVKGVELLRESLSISGGDEKDSAGNRCSEDGGTNVPVPLKTSKWKPKYGTHVAGGFELGVVSNAVALPSQSSVAGVSAVSFLRHTYVSLTFPSLKKMVFFPLWVVEPVFTPLQIMPTVGSTCFAILVLQHGKRVVTTGSDGAITVWLWDAVEAMYMRGFISGEGMGHRGLGRHVCLLRSPDIFISCGYDDGMMREWHIYDEPELIMRCERHFALLPSNSYANPIVPSITAEQTVLGVSCAVSFPPFYALFVVGVFDSVIHTFSVLGVHSCAPPADYVYDGYKTVRVTLPSADTSIRAGDGSCGGGEQVDERMI